ncbi:unnamed protein product [marine sediment metagenome]|uniref:Uncharacterized protein n=1 Tax=marine sediment metagenome TaxID=412755 RepID=X0SCM8_9ZZZZ
MPIREITGYKTSRDYIKLYELAQTQSIICMCNFGEGRARDICRTIFDGNLMEISARGTGYVGAETIKAFIKQCKRYDVEWVLPEAKSIKPNLKDELIKRGF